jgi:PAS domain S-box-containing protein
VVRTHQFAIARRQGEWEVIETPELIQAKQEIKRLNEDLEQRVIERTNDLRVANEELRKEIAERKQAEDALRRSEDRIRLIIDTIPTMAWSIRPDGAVDFVNQRWMDYTGISLEEESEEPTRPIHPEDVPRVMERWLVEMEVGEPYEDELRLRRADGEYRWFLVRTAPLRDEQGSLVKWYGVSIDIEDRKRAEDRLKTTTEQLRALSARLQSAREEEGTRIAREIHDELGSMLTGLKWDLEEISRMLSTPSGESQLAMMRDKVRALIKLTDMSVSTLRRIASELRPSVLDDLGLAAAIEWQAQQFQARTGIICDCDSSAEDVELSAEQSTAVFRIFQEALTNVLRHARATRVNIKIYKEKSHLLLSVSDNGKGITDGDKSEQQSLGILGMRERAHLIGGEVSITRAEGHGTVVTLRVPLAGREIVRKMTR